jgi:DNA modification methylase
LLLDLFSGSGTGAVAASAWGMRSVSIERDDDYVQMIRERVAADVKRGVALDRRHKERTPDWGETCLEFF